MTKELDINSQEILERRPCVAYIEPPVITPPSVAIEPVVVQNVNKVLQLAQAVNVLAEAVQARVDLRAGGMAIKTDDPSVIAAMRRLHPNTNPTVITYDQYKQCKDNLRNRGENIGNNLFVSPGIDNTSDPKAAQNAGGYGTDAAANGGLKPESDPSMQVVEALDIGKFVLRKLEELMNKLWKYFLRPALIAFFLGVGGPIGLAAFSLPKRLFNTDDPNANQNMDDDTDNDSLPLSSTTNKNGLSNATPQSNPDTTTAAPDCMAITKAFEKGANSCATEESVFAMMTPVLMNMRASTATFIRQTNSNNSLLTGTATSDAINQTSGTESNNSLSSNFGPLDNAVGPAVSANSKEGELVVKIGNITKCIPCTFRINLKVDFVNNLTQALMALINEYEAAFMNMLNQILDMLNMFNMSKYAIDLCALRNLLGGMCVPDLRRIIAALMALLMNLAFELNTIFDMILSIVAPLMLPFLMGLINPLQQFFLLIIKPLECIINAIASEIEKLDYSQLLTLPNIKMSIGPQGKTKNQTIPPNQVPFTNYNVPGSGSTPAQIATDTGVPTGVLDWGTTIDLKQSAQSRADIDAASKELQAIKSSGGNIDMKNATASKQYLAALDAAQQKYNDTVAKQSAFTAEWAKKIRSLSQTIKSVLGTLMQYIREAIDVIQNFINKLTEEIRKMLDSVIGGNGQTIMKLFKKLEILQLIAVVIAVIKWLGNHKCDDTVPALDLSPTSLGSGLIVITDPDGTIHIQEDPNLLKDTLDKNGTGKKLGSLVELVSDPMLSTTVAKAVNAVQSPSKTAFKCPLQVTVEDTEKVNKWISQLSAV